MHNRSRKLSRRAFVQRTSAVLASSLLVNADGHLSAADSIASRQATGVKVGEVTPTSAIVWTRLTAGAERVQNGPVHEGKVNRDVIVPLPAPIERLQGACPAADGRIRIRYGTTEDLKVAKATEWIDVLAKSDSSRQFLLERLTPATSYFYAVESTAPGGSPEHGSFRGRFETAPAADSPSNLSFCVTTCQGYYDRGHADGHPVYPSMLRLAPKFVVYTGDNVYYDNDLPAATDASLARYHWQRMASLPRHIELHRNVGGYWLKDDHDTLKNDSWSGMTMGQLEFAVGQRIFREQVPCGPLSYRTSRWGQDLQVWLMDVRDFRSPNNLPDGPEKTIWGREQREWFEQSILKSDATWKVLINPTPIVGPDRGNKNDNHANSGFRHEGDSIRSWIQKHSDGNILVVCGDRHWQYHSVDPRTGLREFSVGPASDEHAGGSPGLDKAYHRFHRVKGGFLSVSLTRNANQSAISVQHRDVLGTVVHEWKDQRLVKS